MDHSSNSNPTDDATTHTQLNTNEKLFLVYDVLMMLIIGINLFTIGLDKFLLSHIGLVAAESIQQGALVLEYRQQLHPYIVNLDEWFTLFLVAELALRWAIAIIYRHHQSWFIFPIVHWYEVLACLPSFRALRLLRAVAIGYRLYQHGYHVIPKSWLKKLIFYYNVILEELSDRIVVTVLDGAERELKSSSPHHNLIQDLVDQHRQMLSDAIAEMLQKNLATALQAQQQTIINSVGDIVSDSLAKTTDLHQLLRLIPVIGSRVEQQVQSIGKHLAENITQGLLEPFTQQQAPNQLANPALTTSAQHVAAIKIDTPALEKLVESMVFSGIDSVRIQVKVQQWRELEKELQK